MKRLTDEQRRQRATTGSELQDQFTDLAELLGWSWVHFRAARERGGWRVPVDGPLGKGWPDLFLGHPAHGVRGVEIKREKGDDPTPEQEAVHAFLRACGMRIFVVRPSDLSEPLDGSRAYAILKGEWL